MKENRKTCGTCAYHDDYSSVCFNGLSPYCAEFWDNDHTCDAWGSKEEAEKRDRRRQLMEEVERQLG